MGITASELKLYPSATVNGTTSNGGRINDASAIVDNVANNAFPDLTAAQLAALTTTWRKCFYRVEDSENLTASNVYLYIYQRPTGDSESYLVKGDQVDTQGAMTFSDLYGVGTLNAGISAGATSIDVLVDDGTVTQFRNGDEIILNDGTNSEKRTISAAPSVASNVITLTISAGTTNAYSSGSTYVAALVPYSTIETSYSNVVETTTSGTFDEAQITVPNVGSIYQNWTLTFTSATAFDLTGDSISGSPIASGNTSSTFAPNNPNTLTPYFSIPSGAWGGTWATSETVVFRTNPAIMPVWIKRVNPASATVTAGQMVDLRFDLSSPS